MSKDIKKLLDKISGKEVNHLRISEREPWGGYRFSLEFDLEINKANLDEFEGKDYIVMYLMVRNRTINDEVDEEEFEWQFQKSLFQESLKEKIYEKYKIEMFGVDLDSLETEYKFL
jgi:hypothetical protein